MKYLFLWLSLFCSLSMANDGAYFTSGNQLIPVIEKQVDVTKEVLTIKRIDNEELEVSVHYEFYNPDKPKRTIVAFEALPPYGDKEECFAEKQHPYIRNFSVIANEQRLEHSVTLVKMPPNFWEKGSGTPPIYYHDNEIKDNNNFTSCDKDIFYAYRFTVDFKSGKNTIKHQYRFRIGSLSMVGDMFNYKLTPINRWGDGKVDTFKLILDMGNYSSFTVHNNFFKTSKNWKIEGTGKLYTTPYNSYQDFPTVKTLKGLSFAIQKGRAIFTAKNFTPSANLYIVTRTDSPYFQDFEASNSDLPYSILYAITDRIDLRSLDTFSRKVLYNYPFARRGYVFKNKRLQDYFDKQIWYLKDPSYKAEIATLSEEEQTLIHKIRALEK